MIVIISGGVYTVSEFATTTHQDYHKKQSEACNILQSKQKVQRRKREVNVQGL